MCMARETEIQQEQSHEALVGITSLRRPEKQSGCTTSDWGSIYKGAWAVNGFPGVPPGLDMCVPVLI